MIAAMLMLLSVAANAQSIVGDWILNKEYADSINMAVSHENVEMGMRMSFTQSDVKVVLDASVGEEGMLMKMQIVIPGTYTLSGDKVTCDFNKEKIDFDIVDIQSNDEEMKEMMSQPGTKKMMLNMIKSEAKKQMGPYMEGLGMMADKFMEFTVTELTETKLNINCDGTPLVFDKKQ